MRTRTLASAAAIAAVAVSLLPASAARAADTPPEVITIVDTTEVGNSRPITLTPTITATVPHVVDATSPWTDITVTLRSTDTAPVTGIALALDPSGGQFTMCGTLPAGGDLSCSVPGRLYGTYADNVTLYLARGIGTGSPSPLGSVQSTLRAEQRPMTTQSLNASPALIAVGDSTRVTWTRHNPNPVASSDTWGIDGEECPAIDPWSAATCSVDITPSQPGRSVTGSVHHPGNDVVMLTPVPVTVVAWPTPTIARADNGDIDVTLSSDPRNPLDVTATVGTETVTVARGDSKVVHVGHLTAGAPLTVSLGAADGDETITHRVALTAPAEMGIPGPTTPDPTTPRPTTPEPTKPEPTRPEPTKPEPTKPGPALPIEGPPVHRVTHIGADVAHGGPTRSAAPAGAVSALFAVAGAGLARRRRMTLDG
ncbi:hypothetical protein [Knoellia sp. LjRoot47]|uniref:hypothetical protein n=1 Tax=Knoellia sp. LjRoot47 TaxID=3342330 RepID=UPI003F4FF956